MITSINPTIIKWARKRMGYTVDEIATKMNVPSAKVEQWESGGLGISYTNLESLAYNHYKIPIAVFFFPNPPNIEDPINRFRRFPDHELDRLSPDSHNKILTAQAYQESLIELLSEEKELKRIWDLINVDSTNVALNAGEIRKIIGVSIDEQYSFGTNSEALKKWRHSIENCGVFSFKDSFKDKYISGFCLLHNEFPVIMLNNSNSFSRQIFTLIHELGHILLNVNGLTDVDESYLELLSDNDKSIEIACNQFTSEFLVPSDLFSEDIQYFEESGENSIEIIAQKYSVSREVILRKLLDNGKISQAYYSRMATKWNQDYIRTSRDHDGGNYYLTKLSYLGEGFSRMAFENYHQGVISKTQLADTLRVRAVNLDNIQSYLNR